MNNGIRLWLSVLILLFPVAALAHPGVSGNAGFLAGAAHPLTGADHILAMLAVGLWAAQLGGRAVWLVPMSFVAMMIAGGALGMAHVQLPMVEQGIMASVLVLGVLVACAFRLPASAGALLVSVFAIFHGYAHGIEMPVSAAGIMYGAGFALITVLLHGAGIGFGLSLQRLRATNLVRLGGVAIAASGLYMALA